MGVSNPRKVWWAVFSSLPQPVGAVVAFSFVRLAQQFLPFGFGFAAGAMVYLVVSEFVPEALEHGQSLRTDGRPELVGGFATGVVAMVPLLAV
jgi:ZIP family zinc transporter